MFPSPPAASNASSRSAGRQAPTRVRVPIAAPPVPDRVVGDDHAAESIVRHVCRLPIDGRLVDQPAMAARRRSDGTASPLSKSIRASVRETPSGEARGCCGWDHWPIAFGTFHASTALDETHNLGPNLGPVTPEHQEKPAGIRYQKTKPAYTIDNLTKSANLHPRFKSGRRLQSQAQSTRPFTGVALSSVPRNLGPFGSKPPNSRCSTSSTARRCEASTTCV
jgi:hypothetical protein